MTSNFKSLATLQSLDSGAIQSLGELGITNLGDLLGYPPFRYARFLRAAKDNLLRRDDVIRYVDDALQTKTIEELLDASTEVLRGLGRKQADILMAAMKSWVTARHTDPAGVSADALAAFEKWIGERDGIAKQTSLMGLSSGYHGW